jgi:hypothetical protein
VLLAGDVAIVVAAVGSVLFVLAYVALAPWYRSLVGWSVFLLTVALAASTTLVSVSRWIGVDWPGRLLVRLLIFSGVGCAVWGLLFTLLVTQISGRRRGRRARSGRE